MERNSKQIPLQLVTRKVCLVSQHLYNIALNVSVKAIRQLEEFKVLKFEKEEIKASLVKDNMTVYISDLKILLRNSNS